jgi:transcriptional regulator with XRE-family HTH domain
METWHKRLATALTARGKTQADLVRATGKKPPSVNGWLTGETKMMEADSSARVCAYLRINALWLFHKIGASGLDDEPTSAISEKGNYQSREGHISVTEPEQEYDELRRQLLLFYDGMSQGHKEAIVMTANSLYSMDNPDDRTAMPFGEPPQGVERRKGVVHFGVIDLSGGKNVHSNHGVPKPPDDQSSGRVVTTSKKRRA